MAKSEKTVSSADESASLGSPLVSLSALTLKARELHIDTYKHLVSFIHGDCSICKSAGFRSALRINITHKNHSIIATLMVLESPLLKPGELGLSESTKPPLCLAIHGIFAGNSYEDINAAGAHTIITCNTIPHPSNHIDLSPLLLKALKEFCQ